MRRENNTSDLWKYLAVLAALSAIISLGTAIDLPQTIHEDSAEATPSIGFKSDAISPDEPAKIEYVLDEDVLNTPGSNFEGTYNRYQIAWKNKGKTFTEPMFYGAQPVTYQWQDGGTCEGDSCWVGTKAQGQHRNLLSDGKESSSGNPKQTKTLVHDESVGLKLNMNPQNSNFGFIGPGRESDLDNSFAWFNLVQIHHHSSDHSLQATYSISGVNVNLNSKKAKVNYKRNIDGDWGVVTIDDLGSGNKVPIDGDWHDIAKLDINGRGTYGQYQVKFESNGKQVWMYERMRMELRGKSGIRGFLNVNRDVERKGSGGHGTIERVFDDKGIIEGHLYEVTVDRSGGSDNIKSREKKDSTKAYIMDKNERGNIAFDKFKYKPGENAKLRYWIREGVSEDLNFRIDWYATGEGNFGAEDKKGSTPLSEKSGLIEVPQIQGNINIKAELMLDTSGDRDILVDKDESKVRGNGISFSKDKYPSRGEVVVNFYLKDTCGEGECKIVWYDSNGNKDGEDNVPPKTAQGTVPHSFENEEGIIKAEFKRNGNTISTAKARIEAKIGRIEMKKNSYKEGEQVKVNQIINNEGIYRMDFYLEGEKVGEKNITQSRGSKTHVFEDSGSAEARLILTHKGEEIKVDSKDFEIKESSGSSNDLAASVELAKDSFKVGKEPVNLNYRVRKPGYYQVSLDVNGEEVGQRELPIEAGEEGNFSFNVNKVGSMNAKVELLDKPEGENLQDKSVDQVLDIQRKDIRNKSEIIDLNAGWNMVSTTRAVSMEGIKSDCELLKFKGFSNWYYLSGEWKHSNTLNPGAGYLLSVKESCEAVIEPAYHQDEDLMTEISRGWNMISTPFPTSLNSIKKSCRFEKFNDHIIWHFNGSKWNNPGMSDELDPNKGYYLKSKNNCELSTTKRGGPAPEPPLPEAREASDASQCIKVNKGLCECGSGGETLAINKDYQEEWESYLNELNEYKPKSCAGVSRCRETKITVKDGMCTLENAD